jgi:hypothetical protein
VRSVTDGAAGDDPYRSFEVDSEETLARQRGFFRRRSARPSRQADAPGTARGLMEVAWALLYAARHAGHLATAFGGY